MINEPNIASKRQVRRTHTVYDLNVSKIYNRGTNKALKAKMQGFQKNVKVRMQENYLALSDQDFEEKVSVKK